MPPTAEDASRLGRLTAVALVATGSPGIAVGLARVISGDNPGCVLAAPLPPQLPCKQIAASAAALPSGAETNPLEI